MQGFGRFFGVFLVLAGWNGAGHAAISAPELGGGVAQVVSERKQPSPCEEIRLTRELNVYKDPTLFLSIQGLLYADPDRGHEALEEETPLLTTVTGPFHFRRRGELREFRGFGEIAKLYERVEPRFKPQAEQSRHRKNRAGQGSSEIVSPPMMVPIQICGDQATHPDFLGFLLLADLTEAQRALDNKDGSLPPSTVGNPIPKLRE